MDNIAIILTTEWCGACNSFKNNIRDELYIELKKHKFDIIEIDKADDSNLTIYKNYKFLSDYSNKWYPMFIRLSVKSMINYIDNNIIPTDIQVMGSKINNGILTPEQNAPYDLNSMLDFYTIDNGLSHSSKNSKYKKSRGYE